MTSLASAAQSASSGYGVQDDLAAAQIARTIVRARMTAGLSQAELASRMSTAQSFISRIESGHARPSMSTLVKVARATGTLLHLELVGSSRPMANRSQ